VAIELRQSNTPRVQTGISGGNELFNTKSAAGLKKPEIEMIRDGKNVLQEFIDSVRKDIESKKKYPSVARDAGFEGRSGVKMVILKNGELAEVELVDSSGHEVLDNAALQSVRDAAPFQPIPEQVGRDRIEMSIYLVFKIT
jgi:TonB family protein